MGKRRYPGVKPFSTTESNLFFGRQRDISRLFKLVNVKQLVVLYSKSGLGKSSLINAGLLPIIKEETRYKPVIVRFGSYRPGQSVSPLNAIKEKISAEDKEHTFLDKLAEPDSSLWYYLKKEQLKAEVPEEKLLIFDQFEELFTYPAIQILEFKKAISEALYSTIPKYYQSSLEEHVKSNREILSKEELELLYKPLRLKMLVAIRSDRLSLIDQLKDYIPDILSNTYQLSALTRTQAEDAILSPAYLDDPDFESPKFDYTDEAVDKILSFLTKGDTQSIESFQLQILCQYIEESIVIEQNDTYIEYDDVGDLGDIFELYYDKLISRIPEDVRPAVRKFLEEGLIFEEEERRLSLYEGQILKNYGISKKLLQQLVDTHIVRSEPNTAGGFSYELSHDSLVKPILRAYQKRREEEGREQEEERRREEYEAYKLRLLEKTKKIRRRLVVGGIVVVVFSIMLVVFALISENYRETQRDLTRMKFLATASDWYRELVANFDNDAQKNIYIRDPQRSIDLRNKALDIGRDHQKALKQDSLSKDSVLVALNLSTHALGKITNDPVLAVQLAREAINQNDNVITRAVMKEVLARSNFYVQNFEIRRDNLLALGFKDEDELAKVTSLGIELINISGNVSSESASQRVQNSDDKTQSGITWSADSMKHFADISRDGKIIVTVDTVRDKIDIWEINQGSYKKTAMTNNHWPVDFKQISVVSLSGDGRYLAIGENNARIVCRNLATNADIGITLDDFSGNRAGITGIEFVDDDRQLIAYATSQSAIVYDLVEKKIVTRMNEETATNSMIMSDDDYVVTTVNNTVSVWKAGTRFNGREKTIFGHSASVKYAVTSPDDRYVLSEDDKERFYVWDINRNQKPIKLLNIDYQAPANNLLSRLSSYSYTSQNPSEMQVQNSHVTIVPSIIFSEKGTVFLTMAGNDVYVWETPYVTMDRQTFSEDKFFARYNIGELDDEQKLAYNVINSESLSRGKSKDELLSLAKSYYNSKKYALAIQFYQRLLDTYADENENAEVLNEFGNCYYDIGEYEKAIPYYEKVLTIEPDYKWALGNLGLVYYHLKEYDASLDFHKKALEVDQNYTASLNGVGNVYYARKQYIMAVEYYRKAVKADDKYKWAWRNLGMSLLYLKKYDEAYHSFAETNKLDPSYDTALEWNQLGNAYYESHNYDRADVCYRNALKIDQNYKWAQYNLGNVEYAKKNYYVSYINFKKALDIDPQYSSALLGMIDAFEKGIEQDPSFSKRFGSSNLVVYCRARVHVRKKELKEAFRDYSEIAARNFVYPKASDWNDLGNNFYDQGDEGYDLARQSYQKAVEADPQYIWAWNNLGLVERRRDELSQAIGYYSKALKIDSTSALVLSNMSEAYFTDKKFRNAVRYQEKAVMNKPGDADYLWTLSWYYLFTKQYAKTINTSKKVLDIDSTLTGVYTNLALGYLFDNQYPEAEAVYKQWMNKKYPFSDKFPTFREAFLQDLKDLEDAGITSRDVPRIRNLLKSSSSMGSVQQ